MTGDAPSEPDPISSIEVSLITLVRRATDPRGNQRINAIAGVDIERAPSVMLTRVEELEPARLSELAEAAGVELSTASRQVAGLVEAGWVERSADPEDRRASAHRLSPAGREVRKRLVTARREWLEGVLAGFAADDRQRFAGLLDRFVTHLDEA